MQNHQVEDICALSPIQQGVLFHCAADSESRAYFEQAICVLTGELNDAAFILAWERLLERHTMLRTAFVWKNVSHPLQVVHRSVDLHFTYHDWQSIPDQKTKLEMHLSEDRRLNFDYQKPPLMRLALIHIASETHWLVWSIHHLIHDSWSSTILIREFFAFYEAFRRDEKIELPSCRQYRDYIAWLRQQDFSVAESYWRELLSGAARESLPSPTPCAAPVGHDQQEFRLSHETTTLLVELSRSHRLTLASLVQGAWSIVLAHCNQCADVVFGAVVACRPAELAGVETIVGPFINTLPVRSRIRSDASLWEWLSELQEQQAAKRRFEHTPLKLIQSWSGAPREQPLFETILVFQNSFVELNGSRMGNLSIGGLRYVGHPNYPLMVRVWPEKSLWIEAIYDQQKVTKVAAIRLLARLAGVLRRMLEPDVTQVSDLMQSLMREERAEQTSVADARRELIGARLRDVRSRAIKG